MRALQLDSVAKDFSGVHAVRNVSLTLTPGELVALIGPNGSGKTTLVNLVTGTAHPASGRVTVDSRDLTRASPVRFATAGVVRTFQGLRLFEAQTVLDNVLVGAQRGARLSLAGACLRPPGFRRRERQFLDEARAALEEVGLTEFVDRPVVTLSHGQRRRVELARALAARPTYLVLDEPGAGLDPAQLDVLAEVIGRRRDAGVGVLLVEHDLGLVDRLATRVLGMNGGAIVAEGRLTAVTAHPALAPHLEPLR
ncbi:MAG TPA: ATP-binding cassette domain-containing protein [Acidimicrobiales bacterium]